MGMSTTTVRNGEVTCRKAVVVRPTPVMIVRGNPRFSVRVTASEEISYVSTSTSDDASV